MSGQTNQVIAVRGSGPVKVDGVVDDKEWQGAAVISTFVQLDPVEGAPASEHTEVRILYDDHNLYIAFTCFDSRGTAGIVRRYGAHDSENQDDSVAVLLDPFRDRQTGFYFRVTAANVQYDALTNEHSLPSPDTNEFSRIEDPTWDGIWQSATRIASWGWSAEIAIPFRSIRTSKSITEWGLNLARFISRKNEHDYWVPVLRFDSTMKPSKAGVLAGLEARSARNLELAPFFGLRQRTSPWAPALEGSTVRGGLDARYAISPSLTLSATLNPDFADTEADVFNTGLSRYEIFYPEKRKFFTEGANYFLTPLNVFFSRRVGAQLPDGEPQTIVQGVKVTGMADGWTVGALEASTRHDTFVDPESQTLGVAPTATFAVARVQKGFGRASSFGVITSNWFENGAGEHTHALDLTVLDGKHIYWTSQAAVNQNATYGPLDAQHIGWISSFNYSSDLFSYSVMGKFLGRKWDSSHTGYEPETDRWTGAANLAYTPFINRNGIRQLRFALNYTEANGTRGELEDSLAGAVAQIEFKNFWTLRFNPVYDRVRFNEFTPDFNILPSTRVYPKPSYRVQLATNQNRKYYLTFYHSNYKLVQYERHFYGTGQTFDLTVGGRPTEHLAIDVDGVFSPENTIISRTHFEDRRFLISRVTYQFTPKLRARILTQYTDERNFSDLSLNSLVAYDFTARSGLFVGFNRQRHSPADRADLGNQFYLKLSYILPF